MTGKYFNGDGFRYFWSDILSPMLNSIKNSITALQNRVSGYDAAIDSVEKKTNFTAI